MEFHLNNNIGRLEVVTGSMFSGKSEELIRRLRRAEYAKQKIVVFKHSIDNRYGEKGIFSHGKDSLEAYPVSTVEQMEKIMEQNIDAQVIGIDEVQFFGETVVQFCKKYIEYGKRVIVAGLDMSFRAEPYHPMPELMAIADQVDKLQAICTVCGKPAYASQRLIDKEPAYYEDPLVMVGASENYEARCRRHHIVRYRNKTGKIYFIIGTEPGVGKKKVENLYYEEIKRKIEEDNSKDNKLFGNDNENVETIVLKGSIREKNIGNEKNSSLSETSLSELSLSELREKIEKSLNRNKNIIIRVVGGILLDIEKNYSIIDLMCEYRKQSEIVIVTKNKKGVLDQLLLMIDTLKNFDLNIKELIYRKIENKEKEESIEVIEKTKEFSKIKYRMID